LQKLSKAQLLSIKNLTSDPKERRAHQKVAVYGSNIIKELPPSIEVCFTFGIEEKAISLPFSKEKEHYVCSSEDLKRMSGQKNPEGIGAILSLPSEKDLSSLFPLLILDQIQDPGNLGTLIRSAYALGVKGVIFVQGGCDPWSEKALRSCQGALFHLPYSIMTQEKLYEFIKKAHFSVLVADMKGEPIETFLEQKSPSKIALLLGNEGQGVLSADANWQKISIPMAKNAESLNVAIAGSILMYLLTKNYLKSPLHASF